MRTKEEQIKQSVEDLFEAVRRWDRGEYDDNKLKLNFKIHIRMALDNGYMEGYNNCERDTEENLQ
jgi:hypothetical protein